MTADGYVPVQALMDHSHPKLSKLSLNMERIRQVVDTNEKQRFRLQEQPAAWYYGPQSSYHQQSQPIPLKKPQPWAVLPVPHGTPSTATEEPAEETSTQKSLSVEDAENTSDATSTLAAASPTEYIWCIRANQGHSIPGLDPSLVLTQLGVEELATLPVICHGTYQEAWKQIQASGGLSRMNRTHIHFAPGVSHNQVISGMRRNCQIYIYLSGAKCAEDKIRFFRSDNGVLLTAGVQESGKLPLKYISHVTNQQGQILFDQRK